MIIRMWFAWNQTVALCVIRYFLSARVNGNSVAIKAHKICVLFVISVFCFICILRRKGKPTYKFLQLLGILFAWVSHDQLFGQKQHEKLTTINVSVGSLESASFSFIFLHPFWHMAHQHENEIKASRSQIIRKRWGKTARALQCILFVRSRGNCKREDKRKKRKRDAIIVDGCEWVNHPFDITTWFRL